MSTLVMKFGGSSVGTTVALTQVLSIVLHEHQQHDRLVLIVSALDGVTDMLLEAAQLAQISNQRGYRRIAATLRTRHLALVEQLPLVAQERTVLQADIDRLLFEMLDTCQTVASTPSEMLSPEISDKIVAAGERLAARIIAALLRHKDLRGVAVDGADIIVTDTVHGNANPDLALTKQRVQQHLAPLLERDIIPVVTGFIGTTLQGKTTTLGRGGSDYTASILSICLNAEEVWIWSDVDGMMTTDPREVETARVIKELSFNEVAELAYFGARILHARMIKPLRDHNIPLRIKNVYKPQQPGTLIHRSSAEAAKRIKAVTSIHGIGLTAEHSGSLAGITRFMDDTLGLDTGADVMISSQSSSRSFLCFIVPPSAGMDAVDTLIAIVRGSLADNREFAAWQVHLLSIITVVGEGIDEMPDLMGQIFGALKDIRIVGLAQGPSRCNLSVIVDPDDAEDALRQIHAMIV